MSLNKFTTTEEGLKNDLKIGCTDLSTSETGVTSLKGNIIPTRFAVAGSILVNTDGEGLLDWKPSSNNPIAEGSVISNNFFYGVSDSDVIVTPTNKFNTRITKIGKIVTYSGGIYLEQSVSGWNYINLDVGIPDGYVFTPSSVENFPLIHVSGATGLGGCIGISKPILYDIATHAVPVFKFRVVKTDSSVFTPTDKPLFIYWTITFNEV